MRILFSTTYFLPYISGISIYASRLAQGLVARGHRVTILTAQFKKGLVKEEGVGGALIKRVPVWRQFHKGVLMPGWLFQAWREVGEHEVCFIHLPQPAGLVLALMAKIRGQRVIGIYHCELDLGEGVANWLVEKAVWLVTFLTALWLDKIVVYTDDYANHSRLLSFFKKKQVAILPPVTIDKPRASVVNKIKKQIDRRKGEKVIGFSGRLAREKGLEVLLMALEKMTEEGRRIKLVLAGPVKEVVGESGYQKKLLKKIKTSSVPTVFLGSLTQSELGAFYQSIDLLVLPSLNKTESFGLVQVEALLWGRPVVATNLPGVRQPVRLTGGGKVVPPGKSKKLAVAIWATARRLRVESGKVAEIFSLEKTIDEYEKLLAIDSSSQK